MNPVYYGGWLFFRAFFRIGFRCRFFNANRVPASGPVILASNHASYFDPPLVGSSLERSINYLARDSLFRFPVLGWLLRQWDSVPVDRDGGGAAGLRAIFDRLQAGGAILLFPEGTRTSNGDFLPPRSGLGLVAIKSTAPVVPVRIFGTYEAYGRHMRIPVPRPVRVKFGQPIWFESQRAEAKRCSKARLKEIYQEVAKQIMVEISNLQPCEDKVSFP